MFDLDQAVQAEIDAWAPRTAPPAFAALAGRKRARDRRRLATGGAALSAVAMAGAAAFASSLGEGRDELSTVASSPAPTAGADGPDALAGRCLGGVATVPVPGLVGMTEQEAFPPNARAALRVVARDGACTTDSAAPPAAGMTDVVLDGGRVVWAGRRTAPPEGSADAVPVPPQDPADAEVCKDTGSGSQCYSVGPDLPGGSPSSSRPAARCSPAQGIVPRRRWRSTGRDPCRSSARSTRSSGRSRPGSVCP